MVRLMYGGRTSIYIGVVAALITTFFAVAIGLLSGYYRGWTDSVISRVLDVIWAFPVLLLGIALGTALSIGGLKIGPIEIAGNSLWLPIIIIGFVYVPYMARPIRGEVLALREKEFVEAAIAQGKGPIRVMFTELLPNLLSTIIVFFTLNIANNMLLEAALSFLGAGVRPPNASWGTMIEEGADRIITAPHLTIIPGLMIVLTVLALNVFGDGLRDALNPKAKIRMEHSMEGMGRFILRRLVGMVAVLFAISVLVFLIFNVIPNSDPAQRIGGKNANPALIERINEDWGFNDPLPQQYVTTMKKVFTGDLVSYQNQRNVTDQIRKGIPITFSLCIGAGIIWLLLGIVFGYLSAVKAGQATDRGLTILALIGISLPVFWLGLVLQYYIANKLGLFPIGDYVKFTDDPLQWANHLILPWFTLAVLFIGFYSRVLRSNMLDVMDEDYVRTARAKGLPERQVRLKHVLRNSLIPVITLFGLDFGAVIGGGAILTETVYNLPGVGQYAGQSVASLDLPPLIGITMFGAFFIVFFNTLVDIVYAYLDPRIRLGTQAA